MNTMNMPSAHEPVVVVDYDPVWPALFEHEWTRIGSAVAAFAVTIEHVGSTAVPGLCAKPIIDILITVDPFGPADAYIPTLAALGYVFRDDPTNVDRHAFGMRDAHGYRPVPGFNAHIEQHGCPGVRRLIAFRDYLRTHPETAREYCALKRALAATYGSDRDGYTAAKTVFVRAALEQCM
ncbi:MAG: GrpB family protein [Ktedonobacterales bacterium]